MSDINIRLGNIYRGERVNDGFFKPFMFDLTNYPLLFVDNCDTLASIMERVKELDKRLKYLKVVIIDRQGIRYSWDNRKVVYNSVMREGYYKKDDPKTLLKRMNSIIAKIREKYDTNPDFFPYTKYVIIVSDISGLEDEIMNMISMIGPIGVYLIFSCDKNLVDANEYIKNRLFGKVEYLSDYQYALEPLKPGRKGSPLLCTDGYAERFDKKAKGRFMVDELF